MSVTLDEIREMVKAVADKNDEVDKKFSDLEQNAAEREAFEKTVTEQIEGVKTALKAEQLRLASATWKGFNPSPEHARALGTAAMAMAKKPWAIKAVQKEGALVKAMGESTDSTGGYLADVEYSRTLLERVAQYGAFRANATVMPMGSEKMYIPKRTGGLTVYNPSEGSPITESEATVGQVELDAELWGILVVFSKQLEEDAMIALGEFLAREMVRAFAKKEDTVGFTGDGTATYFGVTGVVEAIGAGGKIENDNTTKTVTFADLVDLMATLPQESDNEDTRFFMHRTWWAKCMNIVDTNDDPIVGTILYEGVPRQALLGYPVVLCNAMPSVSGTSNDDVFLVFGDLRGSAIIGERKGIEFAQSDHVKFAEVQSAMRAIVREDINIWDAGDASDPGGVVGLYYTDS